MADTAPGAVTLVLRKDGDPPVKFDIGIDKPVKIGRAPTTDFILDTKGNGISNFHLEISLAEGAAEGDGVNVYVKDGSQNGTGIRHSADGALTRVSKDERATTLCTGAVLTLPLKTKKAAGNAQMAQTIISVEILKDGQLVPAPKIVSSFNGPGQSKLIADLMDQCLQGGPPAKLINNKIIAPDFAATGLDAAANAHAGKRKVNDASVPLPPPGPQPESVQMPPPPPPPDAAKPRARLPTPLPKTALPVPTKKGDQYDPFSNSKLPQRLPAPPPSQAPSTERVKALLPVPNKNAHLTAKASSSQASPSPSRRRRDPDEDSVPATRPKAAAKSGAPLPTARDGRSRSRSRRRRGTGRDEDLEQNSRHRQRSRSRSRDQERRRSPAQGVDQAKDHEYWRKKISKMYNRYNPEKLGDLDRILDKYKDLEEELYDALCEKYKHKEEEGRSPKRGSDQGRGGGDRAPASHPPPPRRDSRREAPGWGYPSAAGHAPSWGSGGWGGGGRSDGRSRR